jgi:hypothetical protein
MAKIKNKFLRGRKRGPRTRRCRCSRPGTARAKRCYRSCLAFTVGILEVPGPGFFSRQSRRSSNWPQVKSLNLDIIIKTYDNCFYSLSEEISFGIQRLMGQEKRAASPPALTASRPPSSSPEPVKSVIRGSAFCPWLSPSSNNNNNNNR